MKSLCYLVFLLFSVSAFAQNVSLYGIDIASIYRNAEIVKQQRLQNQLLELQLEQARRGLISPSSIQVHELPQIQSLQPAQSTYAPAQPRLQHTAPTVPRVRYITGGNRLSRNGQQRSAYEGGSISSIGSFSGNVGSTRFQGMSQNTQTTIGTGGPTTLNSTSGGQIGNQQFQSISSGTLTKTGIGGPTVYNGNSGGQIGDKQFLGTTTITQKTIGTNGPTVTHGSGGGQIGNQRYMSTTEGNVTTYRMGGKTIICIREGDQTSCR